MSKVKSGRRHNLLLYYRTMDRVWGVALFAALFITGWLLAIKYQWLAALTPTATWIATGGAIILYAFTVFAFLARKMAYVQARPDHLRIVTPFLRLKISYQRIKGVRTSSMADLFPPHQSSWSVRHFLEPYYARSTVIIELSSLPVSRGFLRLFLAPQMLLPKTNSLVILVTDWMVFSTEIDSRRGSRRSNYSPPSPGGFGLLKDLNKK